MKQHVILGVVVLLMLILLPLVSLVFGHAVPSQQETTPHTQQQENPPQPEPEPALSNTMVPVMRSATDEVEQLALLEYLVGVVAAEMPARFHTEALQAQAVAAHTFLRYRLEVAGAAHLSDSPDRDQGYLCPAQRRERWGERFELYESRIEQAVRAVYGLTLKYNNQPIFAAYHAMSSGTTESSSTYWGGRELTFLQSVESPGCRLAPNFNVTTSFTAEQMRAALGSLSGVDLSGNPASWFGEPSRSEAGTVTRITVGGAAFTGRQIRQALALRSSSFTIAFLDKDASFEVTTTGFGHGVGMSQTGADFMARQGSTYREILQHFYQGAEIV